MDKSNKHGTDSGRRVGYNVNKVRFRKPFGGLHHTMSAGRMSNMSMEIFNDVIKIEEEIESMSVRFSGVAGRTTKEEDTGRSV
jgi:hypothetical protein